MPRSRLIMFDGRTKRLIDWARELGFCYSTLSGRLASGWSIERAFTEKQSGQKHIVAGNRGESLIRAKLYSGPGFKVLSRSSLSHDMIANDARIEAKYTTLNREGEWRFNIHRHGILDESGVDVYVFCLDGVPGGNPLYLVLPAPIGSPTMVFSVHSLVKKYYPHVENWEIIRRFKKYGLTQI